jgi:hypothetical protein
LRTHGYACTLNVFLNRVYSVVKGIAQIPSQRGLVAVL